MAKKNKFNLLRTLKITWLIIPHLINIVTHIVLLAKQETGKAARTILIMVILGIIAAMLFFSIWLTILGMIFISLQLLHLHSIVNLLCILGLNFLCLIIIGIILAKSKKNLTFPATRHKCKSLVNLYHDVK